MGDQPGQHSWHYLDDWKSLPDGTFIAAAKFLPQYCPAPMQIPIWQQDYAGQIDNWQNSQVQIYGFTNYNYYSGGPINPNFNYIPFPTDQSPSVPDCPISPSIPRAG